MTNFYDIVAKKFGGYGFSNSDPIYSSEYASVNPEEVFKNKVENLSGTSLVALDVGCGDGVFAFRVASKFKKIIGLDSSRELLKIADIKHKELKIDNVEFVYGDAAKMPFRDNFFDVIFNRRGPSYYGEYARTLKPGGYYIEIGIGEKDAMALKKAFGRGQDFGQWDKSILLEEQGEMASVGLQAVFGEDYLYNEFYKDKENFELFLQGVPIFEDLDLSSDRIFLNTYYLTNLGQNGNVKLERHRIVIVAQKSD